MTHPQERTADAVGFFTVAKLIAVLVPTVSLLLTIHTLVIRGLVVKVIDEKMQTYAVGKIEYDVRRAEMEKSMAKIELQTVRDDSRFEELQGRIFQIERDLQIIRERQEQVRLRLGMKNGT